MYPFMTLCVHFPTFIPIKRYDLPVHGSTVLYVHRCTCSAVYLFSLLLLFRCHLHNDLSTHLLGYLYTHRSTRKYIYQFTFMLFFRLTTKTYLSPQQLVYMHLDVPFMTRLDLPVKVSTALHVNRCTCSSLYLFGLFLHFRHNMHSYLSTHLLGYVHTDPHASPLPKNKYLPVTTTTCVPALKCTRSRPCHFIFIL